jgi:hypothetical protein
LVTVTTTTSKARAPKPESKAKAPADRKAKGESKAKAKAPRESALDKAIRLQGEASEAQAHLDSLTASASPSDRLAAQGAADAAHGEAVLAWMPVPDAEMPPTARTYVVEQGGVLLASLQRAGQTVAHREQVVSDARKGLETAKQTAARRTADVIAFVRGVIDDHGLMTADGFCSRYGVSKSQVSKWRLSGKLSSKLGVTSPTRVTAINSAVSHDMAGVRAAVAKPGATYETVISDARAKRGETTRAKDEAAKASDETPARQAHRLAVSLTRQLAHLNTTKTAVADFTDPDVSGYSVVRGLLSALSAYAGRELPGITVDVPPASYSPPAPISGKGPGSKRLPKPAAR